MALVLDTGPLVAILDRRDRAHQRCMQMLRGAREERVIPAPVLVEVDHLLRAHVDATAICVLLEDIADGAFTIVDLQPNDFHRIADLIRQYADTPIGFVDAAVLSITERLNEPKLATLDHRHFGMMRPRHVDTLRLVPEL